MVLKVTCQNRPKPAEEMLSFRDPTKRRNFSTLWFCFDIFLTSGLNEQQKCFQFEEDVEDVCVILVMVLSGQSVVCRAAGKWKTKETEAFCMKPADSSGNPKWSHTRKDQGETFYTWDHIKKVKQRGFFMPQKFLSYQNYLVSLKIKKTTTFHWMQSLLALLQCWDLAW